MDYVDFYKASRRKAPITNIRKPPAINPRAWTTDEYTALSVLWGRHTPEEIGACLGRTAGAVYARAQIVGLVGIKRRFRPTKSAWITTATEIAAQAGLNVTELLAGSKKRPYAIARWRAWRVMLDMSPNVSIAGVARISGHDHTTVLHGLARLSGRSVAQVRLSRRHDH
jgi:hypothetical protein